MANTKSASKRARQSPKRTLRNRSVTTNLRSLAKRQASGEGKPEEMRALISALADAPFTGPAGPIAWRRDSFDLDAPEGVGSRLDRDRPDDGDPPPAARPGRQARR